METKLEVFQRDLASRYDRLDGRLEAMQVATIQQQDTLDARLERIESFLSALASKMRD